MWLRSVHMDVQVAYEVTTIEVRAQGRAWLGVNYVEVRMWLCFERQGPQAQVHTSPQAAYKAVYQVTVG